MNTQASSHSQLNIAAKHISLTPEKSPFIETSSFLFLPSFFFACIKSRVNEPLQVFNNYHRARDIFLFVSHSVFRVQDNWFIQQILIAHLLHARCWGCHPCIEWERSNPSFHWNSESSMDISSLIHLTSILVNNCREPNSVLDIGDEANYKKRNTKSPSWSWGRETDGQGLEWNHSGG